MKLCAGINARRSFCWRKACRRCWGRQAWPFYGPKDRNLELGEQVKVNSGLFKQACDLAEKIHVGGKP